MGMVFKLFWPLCGHQGFLNILKMNSEETILPKASFGYSCTDRSEFVENLKTHVLKSEFVGLVDSIHPQCILKFILTPC